MHTNNSESKKPSWNIVIGRKTSLSPKLLESISDIDVLEDACTTYAIAMKKALAVIDEKIKHFYSSVSTSYDNSLSHSVSYVGYITKLKSVMK